MTEFYRKAHKDLTPEEIERVRLIRETNDRLRKTGYDASKMMVILSGALSNDDPSYHAYVMEKVRSFDAFTEDNDPHGEHDFGTIKVEPFGDNDEATIMWQINYYDLALRYGSDEPWNEAKTRRTLTIFYAEDY